MRKQVIAPVERCTESLMPGQRRAASAPDQLEILVEQRCSASNSIDSDAGGGQFKGEGNAIQSAADLGDDRRIGIRKLQRIAAIGDVLDEQLHGGVAKRLRRGK